MLSFISFYIGIELSLAFPSFSFCIHVASNRPWQGQVSLAIAFFFASFGIESTLGRGRLVSPLPSFIFCNFLGIASILCRGSCGLAACPCEEHSDYVPDAICSAVLTTPS